MKKWVIGLVVIIILLIIGGFIFLNKNSSEDEAPEGVNVPIEILTGKVTGMEVSDTTVDLDVNDEILFDFSNGNEHWKAVSEAKCDIMISNDPELKVITLPEGNCQLGEYLFGYFQSPKLNVERDTYYEVRFRIKADEYSSPLNLPELRFRYNSLDSNKVNSWKNAQTSGIGPNGRNIYYTASGGEKDYYFYLKTVSDEDRMFISLDFIKQYTGQDRDKNVLTLKEVEIKKLGDINTKEILLEKDLSRCDSPAGVPPEVICDWTSRGYDSALKPLAFGDEGLVLESYNNERTIGQWGWEGEPGQGPLEIEPGKLYRATFTIKAEATSRDKVPWLRVRTNQVGWGHYSINSIFSLGDASYSPEPSGTIAQNYELLIFAQPIWNYEKVEWMPFIDLINWGMDDDPKGLIKLTNLKFEELDLQITNEFDERYDGLDNDGDGLIDMDDPGSRYIGIEAAKTSQCQDLMDNNMDGLIDMDDPVCKSPQDDSERSECTDGYDNDWDDLFDLEDSGCRNRYDLSEGPDCSDGFDNDGDGLIDMEDPDCSSTGDTIEEQDSDGGNEPGIGGSFEITYDNGLTVEYTDTYESGILYEYYLIDGVVYVDEVECVNGYIQTPSGDYCK